jgi:hypothetical protein
MTSAWFADLPELDDRSRQLVLRLLLDVLVYRDVTRDDMREAYAEAARVEVRYGQLLAEHGYASATPSPETT